MLKRKSSLIGEGEGITNRFEPLSNAIMFLGRVEKECHVYRPVLENPLTKNQKTLMKKKNSLSVGKPSSEARIKKEIEFFLNVGKMSLMDYECLKLKRTESHIQSCLTDKKSASFYLEKFCEMTEAKEDLGDKETLNNKAFDQNQPVQSKEKLPQIKNEQSFDKSLIKNEESREMNQTQLTKSIKKRPKFTSIPFETYYYRLFIWKVNYSNQIQIEIPQEYNHRLKVFVGKGNNSCLVRGLIKRRTWFAVTNRIEEANFVWTQLKNLPYFRIQKESLKTQEKNIGFEYSNEPKFLLKNDEMEMKKYILKCAQSEERSDERMLFRNKYFGGKFTKNVKDVEIKEQRMQNHLINNYVIGNKKALFQTMSFYYHEKGEDVFETLPLTFHIKEGLEDETYFKFLKHFYSRAKTIKSTNSKLKNMWIVKPGENSNRGNGITVCLTLEEIKTILKKKFVYSDGTVRTYIVQSYIEAPLLYKKRKFDIRHYMLMTCVNGQMKGYWYEDGYVRTTSTEYTLNTNNSKIHLTNDAVQKNLPDYGKYEKGNKLSYDELEEYIKKVSSKKSNIISFKDHLLPKMKKIGTDVMKACSGIIDPVRKEGNFEVFGLDFMIDSDFKVYLIEVNSNPCLELSCPLLGLIIPKMVENTLQITLDSQFPPPVQYHSKSKYYLKNLEEENRYDLVYDSRVEGIFKLNSEILDDKLLEEEEEEFEDDGEEFQDED